MPGTLPTPAEAEALLVAGTRTNPGPWADHCRKVGQAAGIIAARCPGMDARKATVLGMLHDIGRQVGPMDMRHIVEGYRFAMAHNMPEVARVSLTHSFAIQDADASAGNWDCSEEDVELVRNYIKNVIYDDYDLLIQLCDHLATPWGFCTLEKRMVDVTLRRGFNSYTLERWRAAFRLLDYFQKKMGEPIYPLLPGLTEYMLAGRP